MCGGPGSICTPAPTKPCAPLPCVRNLPELEAELQWDAKRTLSWRTMCSHSGSRMQQEMCTAYHRQHGAWRTRYTKHGRQSTSGTTNTTLRHHKYDRHHETRGVLNCSSKPNCSGRKALHVP